MSGMSGSPTPSRMQALIADASSRARAAAPTRGMPHSTDVVMEPTGKHGFRSGLALLCHPYHRGGVTRWMADAAAEWSRRGRPSWLIAPTPRTPFYNAWGRPLIRDLLDPAVDGDVTWISPEVDHVFELGTAEYRARCYARAVFESLPVGVPLIVSDDPDVWHGASLVADRHPMIGVMHADDRAYYDLAKRYRGALAALVCVSSRIERSTRELLNGPGAPVIATIPCGIPLPPMPPARSGGSALRMSWAGRMDEEQKRVSDLVRILVRARAEGIDATLDIVGDGPERGRVEAAAAEAGVSSKITFHGWQPVATVMRVLRESDVFLMTSNFEGMPIAIMEALASGCVVVSTRVSGIEDYDSSPLARHALWTFPVGDVHGAAERLRAVEQIPREVRRAAARRLAEAEFAIETCMTRYDAVLSSATTRLEGRRAGAPAVGMPYISALIVATARRIRLHLRGNTAGRVAGHV